MALAIVAWWGIGKFYGSNDAKGNNKIPAVKISAAPTTRKDVPLTVSLAGNVIAYETVSIKSRLDSIVTDVKFNDGDNVQQGQVLFLLDDRALKAQLGQLEASVNKEKAQLENVRLQYERAKKLIETKSVSQSRVDDSKAAYDSQLAVVKAAQASQENTRVQLTYTTITAPISGRAGTINVTRGNNVKANDTQALVTINQVSPIRAQFAIPERYYEQVKAAMANGIPVRASRQDSAEATQGTLEYIDNTIDPTTGAFTARATFTNEKEALWPGMFVTVTIELGQENGVLTIPSVAVQGDEKSHFVFKVVDGKAVKTPVEITRNTGEVAIVSKGLNENDTVITDGLLRVSDGAAVEIGAPSTAAPQTK